jgi:DNA polymerase-3 subunit delta'
MLFSRIQGQDSAVATLRNALTHDRLAHAYLFIGPAGVGKKQTALALAQVLLCDDQSRRGCDTCSSCALVRAGSHPDMVFVTLETGKQSVGIDQIRELQRLLGLRPVRGRKKIALLDDAHLLNAAAQSALLKMLEEPPGDALLVLLTVNAATLSRPLLSRCQQVRFSPLPVAVIEDLLVQEHGKDSTTAHALALFSQGSIGRALALDPQVFTEERRYVEEELQRLDEASFTALSRLAEWLTADRVKKSPKGGDPESSRATSDRLELVLSWYEAVLHYALLGPEAVVRHKDSLPVVAQAASALGADGALRQLTVVYDTIQALNRNANRQLAVEDMLLQLALRAR